MSLRWKLVACVSMAEASSRLRVALEMYLMIDRGLLFL